MTTETRKYKLIITNHARQRWVQRIVDPVRYEHLGQCKEKERECEKCVELMHELHGALRMCGRQIDSRILTTYLSAKEHDSRVTDLTFKQAMAKQHGENLQYLDFLVNGNAILMVSQNPEQDTPILVTVLTTDMIDGTAIKNFDAGEMRKVFKRWKHEARQG